MDATVFEVCPRCHAIYINGKPVLSVKAIGELILPKSFFYIKVLNVHCKTCKNELGKAR